MAVMVGLKSAQGRVKARGGLLGVLNDGDAPGLMLHASLAIEADRLQVVGLADTIMFSRSKKSEGQSRHKSVGSKVRGDKRLTRKEKESYAWELGATNSRRLLEAKGYHYRIYVHDAGSDDKTVISRLLEFKNHPFPHLNEGTSQDDFVIRLRDYQRLFYKGLRRDDKPDLSDIPWLDASLVRTSKGVKLKKTKLGMLLEQHQYSDEEIIVEVRELKHISKRLKKRFRAKRSAKVRVRVVKIRFRDLTGQWHQLNLVQARENPKSIPKKQRKTAINWVLITSLPVDNFEQALRIIDIYRNRWHIEQLFRLLKRDGFKFETVQLSNVEAIIKLMVMALEASAAVLKMVQARDQTEGNPISEVFDNEQVEMLKLVNREYEGRT